MLNMQVIKEVEFEQDQFLSPIFTVPKKNTTEHRMILNLKGLNQHIQYYHFKMETFESAIKLIKHNVLWHLLTCDMLITVFIHMNIIKKC